MNHGDEILQGDVNAHLQETALEALKSRTVPVELLLEAGVKSVSPDELCYQAKGENGSPEAPANGYGHLDGRNSD